LTAHVSSVDARRRRVNTSLSRTLIGNCREQTGSRLACNSPATNFLARVLQQRYTRDFLYQELGNFPDCSDRLAILLSAVMTGAKTSAHGFSSVYGSTVARRGLRWQIHIHSYICKQMSKTLK